MASRTGILVGVTAGVALALAVGAAAIFLPSAADPSHPRRPDAVSHGKAKVPAPIGAQHPTAAATIAVTGRATGTSPGSSWASACGQDGPIQADGSFTVHVPPTESCPVRVFTMVGGSVALGPVATVDARQDASVDVAYPAAGDLTVVDESSPVHAPVADLMKVHQAFDTQCADPIPEMIAKCQQVSILAEKERRVIEAELSKSR